MSTIRRHRLIITSLWLFVVIVSLIYILNNLSVVSDVKQFMPDSSDDSRLQVLLHETQKGMASNLILVEIKGSGSEYIAKLSKSLQYTLKSNTNLFESIINGSQVYDIKSFEKLIEYRYLLKKPDDFSVSSLRESFKALLTAYQNGAAGSVIKYLLIDPQQSFLRYLLAQSGHRKPKILYGVWFSEDESKALLMIQLKSVGFDLDFQQAAIQKIKETVKDIDKTGIVELVLSGPGPIAVSTRDSIRKTTKQVSLVLAGVVIFMFWFGYRSIRLAFLAGIPLMTSIIVAVSLTQLIFGELHGIVLAFGITMLGVCLDYPLHLFSHLHKNEEATLTLRRIWPTLQLGVITSVLSYIALIGTGFSGLSQLAVFTIIGLTVALLVTRWLIPMWVSASWIDKRWMFSIAPLSENAKIFVSVVVIGVPLILLLAQENIWSNDIAQISPVSLKEREIDRDLRRELHAPDVNHVFLITGEKIDEVLVMTEDVKKSLKPAVTKGLISNIQSVADILPSIEQQIYFQSLLPDVRVLKNNIEQAINGLGLKASAFDDFVSSVGVSKKLQPIVYETLNSSPLRSKLQSMLFEQNGKWFSIIHIAGVNNENEFLSWVNTNSKLKTYYMSLRGSTSILMNSYLQKAWVRFLGVLALVVLIVLWLAHKRKEAVWLIVPVISGVVVSLALQVILGNMINIFHILSLLLVIGMGLDYSLFFNQDWKKECELHDRTHAIIISAITTIAAFGTLALSDVAILSAMGQTVSIGIFTCFVVAQRIAVPKAKLEV